MKIENTEETGYTVTPLKLVPICLSITKQCSAFHVAFLTVHSRQVIWVIIIIVTIVNIIMATVIITTIDPIFDSPILVSA